MEAMVDTIIPIPHTVPTTITVVLHSALGFIVEAEATMVAAATTMDTEAVTGDTEVMDNVADTDTVVIVAVAKFVRTLV